MDGGIETLRFALDSQDLLVGSQSSLTVWNLAEAKVRRSVLTRGDNWAFMDVEFSRDRHWMATASADKMNTVRLWDVANGTLARLFQARASAYTLALSPDGGWLFAGGGDGLQGWNTSKTETAPFVLLPDAGAADHAIAFSPDGSLFAWSTAAGHLEVRDFLPSGKIAGSARTFKCGGQKLYAISFSPDGLAVAAGGDDGSVRVWDLKSGQLIRTFLSSGPIRDLEFDASRRRLVSGGFGGDLWEVASGTKLAHLEDPGDSRICVAISPSGEWVATNDGRRVHVRRVGSLN